MERPYSKWITGCIVVIIVIAATIILIGYPFRSHDPLKISFITLTNDATPSSMAVFGATNTSPNGLNLFAATLETKSHGVWGDVPFAARGISLAAHGAGIFTVALPTDHATWRMHVFWRYEQSDWFVSARGNIKANLHFN